MEERMWVFLLPPVVAGLGMLLLVRVVRRSEAGPASRPVLNTSDSNTQQYWPPDNNFSGENCPPAPGDCATDNASACDTGSGFDSGDCGGSDSGGGDCGGGDGGGGCD